MQAPKHRHEGLDEKGIVGRPEVKEVAGINIRVVDQMSRPWIVGGGEAHERRRFMACSYIFKLVCELDRVSHQPPTNVQGVLVLADGDSVRPGSGDPPSTADCRRWKSCCSYVIIP